MQLPSPQGSALQYFLYNAQPESFHPLSFLLTLPLSPILYCTASFSLSTFLLSSVTLQYWSLDSWCIPLWVTILTNKLRKFLVHQGNLLPVSLRFFPLPISSLFFKNCSYCDTILFPQFRTIRFALNYTTPIRRSGRGTSNWSTEFQFSVGWGINGLRSTASSEALRLPPTWDKTVAPSEGKWEILFQE